MFRESLLPLDDMRNYNWVPFKPVAGGWPKWLLSRNNPTLSDEDVNRLQHEILQHEESQHEVLRRDYRALETGKAQTLAIPTEGLPRRLLLIDERPE